MSAHCNPDIHTDGLICCLDANDIRSASSASNNWINIINDGSLSVTNPPPTLTTIGGAKTWEFTASTQFFESSILDSDKQPYLDCTLEAWIYPKEELTTGDRGTIMRVVGTKSLYMSWNKSNQKLSTYWYGHATNGYHETGAAMDRNKWHHVVSVHKHDDDKLYQYTDGAKTTANGTQADSTDYDTSKAGTVVEVGAESPNRQFSGGIALVRIYNTALTDEQVLLNYNAKCGLFGRPILSQIS